MTRPVMTRPVMTRPVMTRRKVIAVDCDGILADFSAPVYRWLNELPGLPSKKIRIQDQHDFDILKIRIQDQHDFDILKSHGLEHLQEELDDFCASGRFCANLPVVRGAKKFVRELRKLGDVVCVTSPYTAVPTWCHERTLWLAEHFGFEKRDVIFTKRKGLISADVLIDDHARNIEDFLDGSVGVRALFPTSTPSWRSNVCRGVLLDKPWNKNAQQCTRVHSLPQALEAVRSTI